MKPSSRKPPHAPSIQTQGFAWPGDVPLAFVHVSGREEKQWSFFRSSPQFHTNGPEIVLYRKCVIRKAEHREDAHCQVKL